MKNLHLYTALDMASPALSLTVLGIVAGAVRAAAHATPGRHGGRRYKAGLLVLPVVPMAPSGLLSKTRAKLEGAHPEPTRSWAGGQENLEQEAG